ncbi:Membrane protein [hydrothermal vent metagenome]|uniref:Membrane protein n=1 Tax=hydrothermal vent metagenome TaxID=652676 RepID=A0A3B1BEI7_9ZZZZ
MKFVEEKQEGLRIYGYDDRCINLLIPRELQLDVPVDPETGLNPLASSFIITRGQLIIDWPVACFEDLNAASMEPLCQLAPELILLGTGSKLRFPANDITLSIREAGIGLEVMDTPAACRTFNVLSAEGRQVAAAVIIK